MKCIKINDSKMNNVFRTLAFFFLTVILYCCSDDWESSRSSGSNTEKNVFFSVRVPSSSIPKTYALGKTDEDEVRTIEILLFKKNDSEEYVYACPPIYKSAPTIGSDDKLTFTASIPEGTYSLVVLANSRSLVEGISDQLHIGVDTKSSVMEQLLLTKDDMWNANSESAGYIPIPMWGEAATTVSSNTSADVSLIRMLSKIDVALVGDLVKKNFTLESIRLYNYNDRGSVAPVASNWNVKQTTVTAPSVPTEAQKTAKPIIYGAETITGGASCIGEIYTFEAMAGNPALKNNTCLVIGGIYAGDKVQTYYRIDFAQIASGKTTYLSLLRNYRYNVNITAISGRGYSTPDEAFGAAPVNIKTEIAPWSDSKIRYMVYDDQYMLGVSQNTFTFYRDAQTTVGKDNILSVVTDYPSGWEAKVTDAEGKFITWLSTSTSHGNSGLITDVTLLLEENTTGVARTGYIRLSAGRLTYVVEVIQNINQVISLQVKDANNVTNISELQFVAPVGSQPVAQQFRLTWQPASVTVLANSTAVGNVAFVYGASSDRPGTSLTSITNVLGSQLFSIQPTVITQEDLDNNNNPFLERISRVDFSIFSGETYLSKTIFLRQSVCNLIADNKTSYVFDGSTYSFRVRSNCKWIITAVTEMPSSGSGSLFASGNLRVGTSGGNNTSSGDVLSFTTANATADGSVSITFSSSDGKPLNKTITFQVTSASHSRQAGSNIYF